MKKINLTLLLLFLIPLQPSAQKAGKRPVPVLVKIHLLSSEVVVRGDLLEVKDSSIVVATYAASLSGYVQDSEKEFFAGQIRTIKARKKNSVGRGAGYGALGGALVGILVALTNAKNYEDGPYSVAASFGIIVYTPFFGAIGTGIGALFGSSSRIYHIDGSLWNFNLHKPKLEALVPPATE